ncbi:MAG TPA: TIGR03016 family PEP-CTERM system-associated outer membrane protein [Gammaproteobacteria bacterium]|nr:TIGR03016 family PEP-CTERM system-associated outer membrane protein [Gammaproteobacteria bacterium]
MSRRQAQWWKGVLAMVAGAAATSAPEAIAGEWRIQPRLGLSETYTDNALLVDENNDPSSDWVTTVSPGISVFGRGRGLTMTTEYTAQKQVYLNNSDQSQLTHLLQNNTRAEVVRDQVFVTAFASMYPTIRNTLGQISNRNRNARDTANRADAVSYGFAPELRHKFGTWANMTGRVQWSDVSTGDEGGSGIGGGQMLDGLINIESGRRFQRFEWGSSFSRRENDGGDTGRRSLFQRWNNTLNYRLNRFVRLNSGVGYEFNDFSTDGGGLRSGLNWQLGATVFPTPRTSITGSFGERSFGSTKSFGFSHRWRHFIATGAYSEDLHTTAEMLRDQQVFTVVDAFGNPVIDPLGNADPSLPLNQLGLTDDVFISRNFNANVAFNRKRNSFSVRVNRNDQESTRTGISDSLLGFGGSWTHRFSYRLAAGLNADWQTRESDNVRETSDFVAFSPYVDYTIGPHVSSRLSYQYMDSVSGDASDDFTENAVTGSLSVAF